MNHFHAHGVRSALATLGFDKIASTGVMKYDPLFAAAQAARAGARPAAAAAAEEAAKPGRWARFLEQSAPLRAGLATAVPGGVLGASVGAGVGAVPDEDGETHKLRDALIGGAIGAIPGGVEGYKHRKMLGGHIDDTVRQMQGFIDEGVLNPGKTVWQQASDVARQHVKTPRYRAADPVSAFDVQLRQKLKLPPRERKVHEFSYADLADRVRKGPTGTEHWLSFLGGPTAEERAAQHAMDDLYTHTQKGLRGEGAAARAVVAGKTPGQALLDELKKNAPELTDKQLKARLHPDAVGRTPGLNPEHAAEAYRLVGRPAAADPASEWQAVVEHGLATRKQREAAKKHFEQLRQHAFPSAAPERASAFDDLL